MNSNTYLVQRLEKSKGFDNPFAFGGGYANGGLSKSAMDLLRPVFSFDYMGAAEYEFGELPKCIQRIASEISQYAYFEVKIAKQPVYVIAKPMWKEELVARLASMAKGKLYTKAGNHFDAALGQNKYFKKEQCRTIGWLELDNGFFFFTDKEVADKTADLFGLLNQGEKDERSVATES